MTELTTRIIAHRNTLVYERHALDWYVEPASVVHPKLLTADGIADHKIGHWGAIPHREGDYIAPSDQFRSDHKHGSPFRAGGLLAPSTQ
jgi:hypothetical protein